jgi:hypothetical protein
VTRQQRVTLIAMTLANSMILVDQTAVPLAIPHIVGDLRASDDLAQWISRRSRWAYAKPGRAGADAQADPRGHLTV